MMMPCQRRHVVAWDGSLPRPDLIAYTKAVCVLTTSSHLLRKPEAPNDQTYNLPDQGGSGNAKA